jgi:hypothetical protein
MFHMPTSSPQITRMFGRSWSCACAAAQAKHTLAAIATVLDLASSFIAPSLN